MKNKKVFGNPGYLDPMSFTTFGISAKNNADPIGKFGTGLKYVIAVMVREGLELWIRSGEVQYTFSKQALTFRDKQFDQIICEVLNDDGTKHVKVLPFTTEFGQNWQLWQVYRELASNCMDEGGGVGEVGDTTIYADLDVDHESVFMPDADLIQETPYGRIYRGESKYIYFKGIRVYELDTPSYYTYSLQSACLTEDRTLIGLYAWHTLVASWLCASNDEKLIKWFFVDVSDKYLESKVDMDYNHFDVTAVSTEFKEAMYIYAATVQTRNPSIYRYYYTSYGSDSLRTPDAVSPEEQDILNYLPELFASMGYPQLKEKYKLYLTRHLHTPNGCIVDTKDNIVWLTSIVLNGCLEKLKAEVFRQFCKAEFKECAVDPERWLAELALKHINY